MATLWPPWPSTPIIARIHEVVNSAGLRWLVVAAVALAFAVAAAADDSKNETLDEGYSLEGLQLNLSTCDLFIVALAMAENSPLIDSFEAGPAETLRREPHLARCAVGADSPLTGPGPGHLAASPMLVAGTTPVFTAIMAGQADWLAAILDAGGDPGPGHEAAAG